MELVKVDGASAIRQTAQGHHPRRTSFTQQRQESAGEREMSEVVGTKLQFEPIGGDMAGRGGVEIPHCFSKGVWGEKFPPPHERSVMVFTRFDFLRLRMIANHTCH